jgi:hypothetical protein
MNLGHRYLSNYDTLGVAGTNQRLAAGAETATFKSPVTNLLILSVSHNTYIAKTAAAVVAAAGGSEDDRILIQADQHQVVIPWFSNDVFFLNAAGGETPTISVLGLLT